MDRRRKPPPASVLGLLSLLAVTLGTRGGGSEGVAAVPVLERDSIALRIGEARIETREGALRLLRARHARLDSVVVQLGSTDEPHSVSKELAWKRVHLWLPADDPEQLRRVLAVQSRGEWRKVGKGWHLVPTTERQRLIQRARRADPDEERPATPHERAALVDAISAAARDPEALRELERTHPVLARQLRDSVTGLLLGNLGTLAPYQKQLMTGPQGLWLSQGEVSPALQQQLHRTLSTERDPLAGLRKVGLRLGGSRLLLAIDMAEAGEQGGNAVFTRGFDLPGQSPRPPFSEEERPDRPDDRGGPDAEAGPMLELEKILVPDPNGTLPYKLYETLDRLAHAYPIGLAADIQFQQPRAHPESDPGEAYRTLQETRIPLGRFLRALGTIFGFRYHRQGDAHLLTNRWWYWEEEYSHSDAEMRQVQEIPGKERATLEGLERFLSLKPAQLEGLSLLFPELRDARESRPQAALFHALTSEQRQELRTRGTLAYAALTPPQRRLLSSMLDADLRLFPREVLERLRVRYQRTTSGERLESEWAPVGGAR